MAKKLKLVQAAAPVSAAKSVKTVAKAAVKPTTKAAPKSKEEKKSRFIGLESGLGVTAFQNLSLEKNAKNKLTDEELAEAWQAEFPNSIARYTAETVSGVRGLYNKGKHGNEAPATPLRAYDAEGNVLPLWGEKSREKEAVKAEKAEAAAAAAKAVRAAKTGKTVAAPSVVKKAKRSA